MEEDPFPGARISDSHGDGMSTTATVPSSADFPAAAVAKAPHATTSPPEGTCSRNPAMDYLYGGRSAGTSVTPAAGASALQASGGGTALDGTSTSGATMAVAAADGAELPGSISGEQSLERGTAVGHGLGGAVQESAQVLGADVDGCPSSTTESKELCVVSPESTKIQEDEEVCSAALADVLARVDDPSDTAVTSSSAGYAFCTEEALEGEVAAREEEVNLNLRHLGAEADLDTTTTADGRAARRAPSSPSLPPQQRQEEHEQAGCDDDTFRPLDGGLSAADSVQETEGVVAINSRVVIETAAAHLSAEFRPTTAADECDGRLQVDSIPPYPITSLLEVVAGPDADPTCRFGPPTAPALSRAAAGTGGGGHEEVLPDKPTSPRSAAGSRDAGSPLFVPHDQPSPAEVATGDAGPPTTASACPSSSETAIAVDTTSGGSEGGQAQALSIAPHTYQDVRPAVALAGRVDRVSPDTSPAAATGECVSEVSSSDGRVLVGLTQERPTIEAAALTPETHEASPSFPPIVVLPAEEALFAGTGAGKRATCSWPPPAEEAVLPLGVETRRGGEVIPPPETAAVPFSATSGSSAPTEKLGIAAAATVVVVETPIGVSQVPAGRPDDAAAESEVPVGVADEDASAPVVVVDDDNGEEDAATTLENPSFQESYAVLMTTKHQRLDVCTAPPPPPRSPAESAADGTLEGDTSVAGGDGNGDDDGGGDGHDGGGGGGGGVGGDKFNEEDGSENSDDAEAEAETETETVEKTEGGDGEHGGDEKPSLTALPVGEFSTGTATAVLDTRPPPPPGQAPAAPLTAPSSHSSSALVVAVATSPPRGVGPTRREEEEEEEQQQQQQQQQGEEEQQEEEEQRQQQGEEEQQQQQDVAGGDRLQVQAGDSPEAREDDKDKDNGMPAEESDASENETGRERGRERGRESESDDGGEGGAGLEARVREFNAWLASSAESFPVRKVKAGVVGNGMRLGAVATERIDRGEPYLSVSGSIVLDASKVRGGEAPLGVVV